MFGFKKNNSDKKETSKTSERSSSDSRFASGNFAGHSLSDSQLNRAYGGVNATAHITCPKCRANNVKTKLKTLGANGAVYSHECSACKYKWETADAPTSI